MDKPDVDVIEGLSPAISIDQKSAEPQPPLHRRHDHRGLRLPAPALRPHRHAALPGRRHAARSARRRSRSSTASCCCPRAPASRCWHPSCEDARASTTRCSRTSRRRASSAPGSTARSSTSTSSSSATDRLARYEQHKIEVVVDRLVLREGITRRLTDSLETALKLADGVAEVELVEREGETGENETLTFSQHLVCPLVREQLRGAGAAQLLVQLAVRRLPDVRRLGHDVRDRPRAGHPRPRPVAQRRRHRSVAQRRTRSTSPGCWRPVAEAAGIDLDAPWGSLTAKQQKVILHGTERQPDGQVQEPVRPPARSTRRRTRA